MELRVGYKDEAYLHHMYCRVKKRSKDKIKSYNLIKMCMCRDMMDMVRWVLGLEWELYITISIINVLMIRCRLGPDWVLVITI
jgi:hypothetical protein